jgi:DNA replication protein DnaC
MVEAVIDLGSRQQWPFAPIACFTKALTLTQAWRGQKLGDEVDPECVAAAKRSPLLLLDDVGQEANDQQNVLMGIADHRYDGRKPSIVTSGLQLPALLERYSEAWVRRWLDACGKDSGQVVDLWAK